MILDRAKAWVALIGAILTALIASGTVPTGTWYDWLTTASVMVTAVLTYLTPNKDKEVDNGGAAKD